MAGPSWRALGTDVWNEHSYVILSDGGPSGRKGYECYDHGSLVATRPSLGAAKEFLGRDKGWGVVRQPKIEVEHYHFGPTTEFTSPTTVWAADD